MNIGIIGTGGMGRALGVRWASAGHSVYFGSRDPVRARNEAAAAGTTVRGGTNDESAAFGDVVLYTVRGVMPSQLLTPGALAGKISLDSLPEAQEEQR